MAKEYYLGIDNQQLGPFHKDELLLNGMTEETLVWTEGMSDWLPASDVAELAPLFNSTSEIPPRPYVVKWMSILGLFGVTPLGVLGLVFGSIANKRYDKGNYEEAENMARLARKFGWLGFICFWLIGLLISNI